VERKVLSNQKKNDWKETVSYGGLGDYDGMRRLNFRVDEEEGDLVVGWDWFERVKEQKDVRLSG